MRNWKEIGKKLLFPPRGIIVILTLLCTLALVSIFVKGWELTLIAYVSYVISFYALVVLCIACWKVLPGYYKVTRNKLHENKYIDRYMTDAVFKTNIVFYVILGNSYVCTIWSRYIRRSKKYYDYGNRSRNMCGCCFHGNLYDCTNLKGNKAGKE